MAPIDRRTLRLLEVGCGLGNLLVEAQARGYDVTGIEYSESSVRAANANLGATRVLQGCPNPIRKRDGRRFGVNLVERDGTSASV